MIKVLVNGALGKMGREVINAVNECSETELAGAVDIMGDGIKNLSESEIETKKKLRKNW